MLVQFAGGAETTDLDVAFINEDARGAEVLVQNLAPVQLIIPINELFDDVT